jgi:uncharacterized repeat protein (TIGR01451 family)
MTDELDERIRFVSSDDGCTAQGQEVTCAVGDLAVGSEAQRSFVVEVVELPGPGQVVPNVARVDGDQPNPDCAEPTPGAACNEDDEDTPQPSVDLGIAKTDDDAVVRAVGDRFAYRLTTTNAGPDDATGVTITDELDPRLAFVGSESCAVDGRIVTCPIGDLAADEAREVAFEVEVVELPEPGRSIPNVASVAGAEPDPDCVEPTPDAACNEDDEDTPRPGAPPVGPPETPRTAPTAPGAGPATPTPTPTSDGWLPVTGASTRAWIAIGVTLVGGGSAVSVLAAKRRRSGA